MIHRRYLTAVMASAVLAAGLTIAAAPAGAAITCPAGSITYQTENDANGVQMVQNADNYGTGADTCFSATGTDGQMTITQADNTSNPSFPTSYPNDDYGCTTGYCTTGWTTGRWQPDGSPAVRVNFAMSNTGVNASDVYDYLTDTFFTDSSHTGVSPPVKGEVEVISDAFPSYSHDGFCVATSCGATEVTINSLSWWRSFKTAGSGSATWPDTIYVKDAPVTHISNEDLWNFWSNANSVSNCSGSPCYSSLYAAAIFIGSEQWPRTNGDGGLGISVTSASVVNEP